MYILKSCHALWTGKGIDFVAAQWESVWVSQIYIEFKIKLCSTWLTVK